MDSKQYFETVDFVVFGGCLIVSCVVGLYFAIKDRNKMSTMNYYFGGKQMSPIAIGVSLAVTYISAITIIGSPTESYLYGTVALWYPFAYIPGTMFGILYYAPMMHRLQLKTVFEYLELRFSSYLRKWISATEFLGVLIYMCFALLVPALAISAVTPIGINLSIILTSAVCTLYTTMGGIKAVVWTDVVQFGFMLFGSVTALIMAIIEVGGIGNVWSALDRGGRLNFFEFDPDPTLRTTAWTVLIGGSVVESVKMCTRQTVCQRYLACSSVAGARKAAVTTLCIKFFLSSIAYVSGAVAYAYFEGCDPLASGAVTKSDQMFPYLVLKVFRNLPGMAGLFVAAAFSGSLSTVSSGLSAMSAQLLEDFILPLRPNISRSSKNAFSKLSVLFLGVIITGITYIFLLLEGTVVSMLMSVKSGFIGAVIGVYTLGMFLPWCNAKGALAGQLSGLFVATWLGVGGLLNEKSPESQRKLPVTTQCCNVTESTCHMENITFSNFSFEQVASTNSSNVEKEYNSLYALSFWYLATIGLFVTVSVGLLVSFITGANDPTKSDPRLFCPLVDNRRLPEKVRRFFRFGVPDVEKQSRGWTCEEATGDEGVVIVELQEGLGKGKDKTIDKTLSNKNLDDI